VQPTENDEFGLIQRIAEGDQRAFLEVYDQYAAKVYSLALRILSDSMLAEEATQDTFVKLWGRARTYVPERGSFAVWLLTIARRTCLDRLRQERRRPVLSDERDPDTAWGGVTDRNVDPAEARWRSLRFAVMALPDDQRQVIELAYYQGMSQSEIAAELGWPLGTVKTRMRTAMQALRQGWKSEGQD
jgi:RNA polymerase sigma-70 factor (ECF subfamily)